MHNRYVHFAQGFSERKLMVFLCVQTDLQNMLPPPPGGLKKFLKKVNMVI
jgi:hypothetical protein